MRSLEVLDLTMLNFGARVVLVGTTTYEHYKHGEIQTEAIAILHGSFDVSDSDWNGTISAQVSIAYGVSHSNREQGDFLRATVYHPDTIKIGETLCFTGSASGGHRTLTEDTPFTIASIQAW